MPGFMKNLERDVMSIVFSMVPNSALCRLSGIEAIIPYYHMVNDFEVPHTRHLYRHKNVKQFESDIEYLLKHYEPVGLNDILRGSVAGKGNRRKSFLLTFDDGFREMHDIVAPILRRKGIPAAFFVSTGFVDNVDMCYKNKASLLIEECARTGSKNLFKEMQGLFGAERGDKSALAEKILEVDYQEREVIDRALGIAGFDFGGYMKNRRPYLETAQIEKMIKDGFHIGAHSIDHPFYATIPLEEQVRQTKCSLSWIREKFGLEYGAFAFPHSDRGVGSRFFDEIYKGEEVDISFGTGGLGNVRGCRHLQRFSMEKPLYGARRILGYQYGRTIIRNRGSVNEGN